ncbi:MAG TPA: class I SAM-dependent methyltransferase [Polyangiaceae bacterium]|nr:class I SAM-dependent methyltransferase [Polyangiaceae bacterium]
MRAGAPSATAEAMAAARAFGSHVYRREGILNDPYAEQFLSGRFSTLYRFVRRVGSERFELGLARLYDRMLPGSIGWVLTRHRYFDDAIDEAVRNGARQVVLVGAGYDSRAFRRSALAAVKIFEVDHPDTQRRKTEIVRRIFGRLPEHVRYLPLDATRGDLRQLPERGFERSSPTVFALEGFLWYMPPDVARAILQAIAELAAPGSEVIFDYILPSVVAGTCLLEGAEKHRQYCARRGEPILFGIEPEQLARYCTEVGLSLLDDIGGDALSARYTTGARLPIKVYPFLRIARARK